jgi:hypothetical protein
MVNTTAGWREMRLAIFARRQRGKPVRKAADWHRRKLPAPHVRVIRAAIRTSEQLGPGWRRMAARLGLTETASISVIADGAKWIWNQVAGHLRVRPACWTFTTRWSSCGRRHGSASARARPRR